VHGPALEHTLPAVQLATGTLLRWYSDRSSELIIILHLMLKLRMSRAVLPLPRMFYSVQSDKDGVWRLHYVAAIGRSVNVGGIRG
jgi:hypothetical protein